MNLVYIPFAKNHQVVSKKKKRNFFLLASLVELEFLVGTHLVE